MTVNMGFLDWSRLQTKSHRVKFFFPLTSEESVVGLSPPETKQVSAHRSSGADRMRVKTDTGFVIGMSSLSIRDKQSVTRNSCPGRGKLF
jgi:hypothetical protein